MKPTVTAAAPAAIALAALAGSTALTPAAAATDGYQPDFEAMSLENWDRSVVEDAWQADELIEEADVYGANGDEIGEVEDIVIEDGAVSALIVESDGFLDIGDTHFKVPFEDVSIVGYDTVNVPLSEARVEEFDMTRGMDDEPATGPAWRVSAIINDYAVLNDGGRYGYVEDMMIGQDGDVEAVLIDGSYEYGYEGPYAMPYYGYDQGWQPGFDRYYVGYGPDDLENLPKVTEQEMTPYWEG